jgi:hypothetical protein
MPKASSDAKHGSQPIGSAISKFDQLMLALRQKQTLWLINECPIYSRHGAGRRP